MERMTLYRAGADGKWHHSTLPDVLPPEPPDPEPTDTWFGVTIFGESYGNYKNHQIGSPQNRYYQVEYDTVWDLGGSLGVKRGSGVSREFGGDNVGTWTGGASPNQRNGQPICYSFKDGPNVNQKNEATFKADFIDFIDSHTGTDRCWLVFHHEWDNDANMGNGNLHTGAMGNWYDRNMWIAQVLTDDRPSAWARNGGWLKFGHISVGTVYTTTPTADRGFQTYCENMMSHAGVSELSDIWDFGGVDKYNPGWKATPMKYIDFADYIRRPTQFHDRYGLPFVIGESGSPRIDASGTVAQRNAARAAWLDAEYQGFKDLGWIDAVMYWRVPSNEQKLNPWSTNMVTPTGYDATMTGYQYTTPQGVTYRWSDSNNARTQGGFDDQLTSDVISEYCLNSIAEANAIATNPTISYYTGSGGFG